MKPIPEIDALRQQAILSSLAGFPFLLVFALVWIAGATLSYLVPRDIAPWIYVLLGMPATPIAIALERRLGYVRVAKPDLLLLDSLCSDGRFPVLALSARLARS